MAAAVATRIKIGRAMPWESTEPLGFGAAAAARSPQGSAVSVASFAVQAVSRGPPGPAAPASLRGRSFPKPSGGAQRAAASLSPARGCGSLGGSPPPAYPAALSNDKSLPGVRMAARALHRAQVRQDRIEGVSPPLTHRSTTALSGLVTSTCAAFGVAQPASAAQLLGYPAASARPAEAASLPSSAIAPNDRATSVGRSSPFGRTTSARGSRGRPLEDRGFEACGLPASGLAAGADVRRGSRSPGASFEGSALEASLTCSPGVGAARRRCGSQLLRASEVRAWSNNLRAASRPKSRSAERAASPTALGAPSLAAPLGPTAPPAGAPGAPGATGPPGGPRRLEEQLVWRAPPARREDIGAGEGGGQVASSASAGNTFKLRRFTEAQKEGYAKALREIQAGKKMTCWMWFVIPTPPHIVRGVERGSCTNRKYALRSDEEVHAYLAFEGDSVSLRSNYLEIMGAVRDQLRAGVRANSLVGTFDGPKLASSAILFERVAREGGDAGLHGVVFEVLELLGIRPER